MPKTLKRYYILSALAFFILGAAAGCGKGGASIGAAHGKALARINDYELTVEDFKAETRLTAANKYLSGGPDKAKEALLDELITKKVLIQEAQKQNFDKDNFFMKEIERYWEQALLKLLFKKKTEELSREVGVDEREGASPETREDIRNRKIQAMIDRWIAGLKEKARITVNKDALKEIEL